MIQSATFDDKESRRKKETLALRERGQNGGFLQSFPKCFDVILERI